MRLLALILCATFLTACASETAKQPSFYFNKKDIPLPQVDSFPHCRSYGCAKIDMVSLSEEEWETLRDLFTPPPEDAQSERKRLIEAVKLFEIYVGKATGTEKDVAGTYKKLGHFQHDCIDESTNTTVYLTLIKQQGWMIFHTPQSPTSRAPILSGRLGPHRTGLIKDNASGQNYAIDSWFHDNGERPELVPLKEWKKGWHPTK